LPCCYRVFVVRRPVVAVRLRLDDTSPQPLAHPGNARQTHRLRERAALRLVFYQPCAGSIDSNAPAAWQRRIFPIEKNAQRNCGRSAVVTRFELVPAGRLRRNGSLRGASASHNAPRVLAQLQRNITAHFADMKL
jgi:hypothetical protein